MSENSEKSSSEVSKGFINAPVLNVLTESVTKKDRRCWTNGDFSYRQRPEEDLSTIIDVRMAIESLNPREELIANYLLEGYTWAEVTDLAMCSMTTVKKVVDLLRLRLKDHF